MLWVHKIAIATTVTRALSILSTACFPKISDWGKFSNYSFACIVAAI